MPSVAKPKRQRQKHFLREWRESLHLNQDGAAERIGISRENLSRIERGLVPYSQDFLEAAAEAYGTSPASLIMRDPSRPDPLWSIQDQLQKATPDEAKRILAVVETMLKSA